VALAFDRSAVGLHDMVGDRQTKTKPRMRTRGRAIGLTKVLEDVWKIGGIDAATIVANADAKAICIALERYVDATTLLL
jgi:hypothetical protein